MTREAVLGEIEKFKPRIVYVSGKTCTGKTTFATEVGAQGYSSIELDPIVTSSVVIPFNVLPGDGFRTAYRDIGPAEQTAAFITAAKNGIAERFVSSPIVVEGAIARSRILKEIFSGELNDFFFVYFHPMNTEAYIDRLRTRFIAGATTNTTGLPKDFWALIRTEDLDRFLETTVMNESIERAIRQFAQLSMKESEERLIHLKESFPDIRVVDV